MKTGALDVVATAVPGMKDILVLGKVKSLDVQRTADLIIVDAPAAGHAITFLTSAQGLLDAVSVGPVRKQATDVVELLSDPERCQVLLVTIPEETPVSELVDTAFAIEDRTGVCLGPVVVNGCYEDLAVGRTAQRRRHQLGATTPPRPASSATPSCSTCSCPTARRDLARAAAFRSERAAIQHHQADRLGHMLPLPQIRLPFLFTADLGRREIEHLADAFTAGVERAVTTHAARGGRRAGPRRRLLRQRRRGQDDERRGPRDGGRAPRPARRRRDDRPGQAPRQRARARRALERAAEIATARWDPKGERKPGGALSAMMLDTKSTFDGLVTRYAVVPEQTQRILENSFYRNISSALSGTQEYMAMEKLHELHEEGGFDLIVVDTPPSRHALDFLDAPQRLLRLLDNRIFRLLMVPTRTGMRIAGAAVQAFLRTISRVVGSEVVNDIVAFFRAFEGMEEGFRERAKKVVELLGEPETRFVLITSPRRDAVEEARFFAEKIGDHNLAVDALIVNRVHPRFGTEHSSGSPGPGRVAPRATGRGEGRSRRARAPLGPVRQPRGLQRDRRARAQPPRDGAGAGRIRGGRVRPLPRPRRVRLRRPRDRRPDPVLRRRRPGATRAWGRRLAFRAVDTILVAAEASWIRDQVQVAFVEPGQRVIEVKRGQDVRDAVGEYEPSVVILDMQIGNMGGIAVALDLRLEAGEGRLPRHRSCCCSTARRTSSSPSGPTSTGCWSSRSTPGRLRRAVKDLLKAAVAMPRAGPRRRPDEGPNRSISPLPRDPGLHSSGLRDVAQFG